MKLDKIEVVTEFCHIQIREIKDDGGYHRRGWSCHHTLPDDEYQEVKDKAKEVWTDEVKAAWAAHQAEEKALRSE